MTLWKACAALVLIAVLGVWLVPVVESPPSVEELTPGDKAAIASALEFELPPKQIFYIYTSYGDASNYVRWELQDDESWVCESVGTGSCPTTACDRWLLATGPDVGFYCAQ